MGTTSKAIIKKKKKMDKTTRLEGEDDYRQEHCRELHRDMLINCTNST